MEVLRRRLARPPERRSDVTAKPTTPFEMRSKQVARVGLAQDWHRCPAVSRRAAAAPPGPTGRASSTAKQSGLIGVSLFTRALITLDAERNARLESQKLRRRRQ